jgi:myo-inositol-1(or 4)-monophosphatase
MKQDRFSMEVCDFLRDLLPRTGQIVRRYFHSEDLLSYKKGIHDFVTAADLAVNKFLEKELGKKYPNISILTEEGKSTDYVNMRNNDYLWIIDPLDGTANFTRGDNNFSISVALVRFGRPVVGVIFVPVTGRLFWPTVYNKQSFWNGRTIKVSSISELNKAVVCTDWSHLLETRDETTNFLRKIYGKIKQVKILGSAATDITLLARGGVDIYYHVRLFPWDTAAAGLIAQAAGAKVTDIDGSPWTPFSRGIVAANPTLHKKIFELLNTKNG